jgi:hypothetical protein
MFMEREWQFLPHPERGNKVAALLLQAYRDPFARQIRGADVQK